MWRAIRFLLRLGICLTLLAVLALCAVELWVNSMTAGHCHTRTADCRQGDVGVVLGCSKYLRHGVASAFFEERMDAAAELWKAGKLRCIIVSGDNREKFYNEPRDMKEELVRRGVPADRIVCDYAGLRTYDSVVRAERIFGAKNITFISQREHVERAVSIARQLGMQAEGYATAPPAITRRMWLRQYLRERAARLAMVVDLLLEHDPAHLGTPIRLPQ